MSGGTFQADSYTNSAGTGAPNFPYGNTSSVSTPTAAFSAIYDSNVNLSANSFLASKANGADAATSLTVASAPIQYVVPTANRVYTLPTTGVLAGQRFTIINGAAVTSSDLQIAVNSSGANLIRTIWAQTSATFVALVNTPTTAANWMCETPAMSNWTAYTPTFGGYGTPTNVSFLYRRVGSNMEITGSFTTGTCTAALGTTSLPSSFTLATSTFNNTTSNPGPIVGTIVANGSQQLSWAITATGTSTSLIYLSDYFTHTSPLLAINVTTSVSNGIAISFVANVQISTWTATGG